MKVEVSLTVNLPLGAEERLRAESPDLPAAIREGFLVNLFRRGILDRHGLSLALGLDRFETFALLKRHEVFDGTLTHEEVDADVRSINELIGPPRP